MKHLSLIFTLFAVSVAVGIGAPEEAQADAEQEVLATARAIIEAANAGDRATMKKLHTDFHSAFNAEGGLLTMPRDMDETSSEEQTDSEQNENTKQEVTWKFSHWKHPEIYVNGNMAFMTGYLEFTREIDGESKTVHWRDTCIFEKNSGEWSRIHHHTSPLIIAAD